MTFPCLAMPTPGNAYAVRLLFIREPRTMRQTRRGRVNRRGRVLDIAERRVRRHEVDDFLRRVENFGLFLPGLRRCVGLLTLRHQPQPRLVFAVVVRDLREEGGRSGLRPQCMPQFAHGNAQHTPCRAASFTQFHMRDLVIRALRRFDDLRQLVRHTVDAVAEFL